MFNKIYVWIKDFIKVNYKELLFLVFIAFISFYKLPYLVYKPGGSINLATRVEVEGKQKVNGSYSMNYVSVSRGNIPTILLSYLIKDWELLKEETITGGVYDYNQAFKLEQLEFQNAMFLAIYNACSNDMCKIEITKQDVYVYYIDEKADTDLAILDKIISIDGKSVANFYEVRELISKRKVGDKLKIIVDEDGKEVEKYATVFEYEGVNYIGVSGYTTYDYNTTPKIEIKTNDKEAGASGGLMLTLAIYDYLNDDDIAKNRKIMGTGTINEFGDIGPIGGVKYKMLGAKKDKADIFFVPMQNCEEANEVKKEYNIKYEVKCIEKFEDAVNFLTSN